MLKIGELFDQTKGWWLALILHTTLFISEFWKFENDLFGYLFAFWAFYFLLKHYQNKGWAALSITSLDLAISIVLFVIAGFLWNGTIYWLIPASLFSIAFIPILFGAILIAQYWNGTGFFWFIGASEVVIEQAHFVGLIWLGVPLFAVAGMLATPKKINIAFLFTIALTLFVAKFFVLAIPFMCIIAFNLLNNLSKKLGSVKSIESPLIIFCLFMSVFSGNGSLQQFPNEKDIELIQNAIKISPNLENNFTVAHLITYFGGIPSCSKGGLCEYKYSGYVIDVVSDSLPAPKGCIELEASMHLKLLKC